MEMVQSVGLSVQEQQEHGLRTIKLLPSTQKKVEIETPRRSPRKAKPAKDDGNHSLLCAENPSSVTSFQRQIRINKISSSNKSPSKALPRERTTKPILGGSSDTTRETHRYLAGDTVPARCRRVPTKEVSIETFADAESLLSSFSRLHVRGENPPIHSDAPSDNVRSPSRVSSKQSRPPGVPTFKPENTSETRASQKARPASQFILHEAACDEDLLDSNAEDDGDEEDTDLSGFIVDDDAELSYHDSSEEIESEPEQRHIRQTQKGKLRRRLQRGRRKIEDSEEEKEEDAVKELVLAVDKLKVAQDDLEHSTLENAHDGDAVSSEHFTSTAPSPSPYSEISCSDKTKLFDKLQFTKLSPPRHSQHFDVPTKAEPQMNTSLLDDLSEDELSLKKQQFKTPPATPPRSPSKLKSPSKLLSPTKRREPAPRSPHRQSMDAFWDLGEVNQWNDQFSPKKVPIMSPRKNRKIIIDLCSDDDEKDGASPEVLNDSFTESLPSPCESPTKPKCNTAAVWEVEQQRLQKEKVTRKAEKQAFENSRDEMARALVSALDLNVANGHISQLSRSTGGVKIIWSKTLRSTAGRANWRRMVTRLSGAPTKIDHAPQKGRGYRDDLNLSSNLLVEHFASIELASKIIDRPARLISTLAHEFCHLANFMVSGVRDQPHGASFQAWGKKVTAWMKSQTEVPLWQGVEVTTKHSYVIDWKYLWACVGRPSLAMDHEGGLISAVAVAATTNDEDDGCGAEYGRHSKSIDPMKHRCGKCKGKLVQVRPRPRASPMKKDKNKRVLTGLMSSSTNARIEKSRTMKEKTDIGSFDRKLVEIIELSD